MLLENPPFFGVYFVVSFVLFFVVGSFFSLSVVWKHFFSNIQIYLKSGEYGESRFSHSWSLFKEPINAWSSLVYSIFGGIAFFVGLNDLYSGAKGNVVSRHPEFSMMFGVSCIILGVSSCLFHASHSEFWRAMDAGMTSGVTAPSLALAFFDRARPIGINSGTSMILFAILLQISLTHGYLPYGSSDFLLPTLVIICFILELSPRYGGAVDADQFVLWYRVIYITLSGVLLRASDILYTKHKSAEFGYILKGYLALTLAFIYVLGGQDLAILVGCIGGAVVWRAPYLGHMFWHFFSSFALFYWWFMYRVRPGDPSQGPRVADSSLLTLFFFIAMKNAVRRIFMTLPFGIKGRLKDRFMFMLEHVVFAYWGYQVIHVSPGEAKSWLSRPVLSWDFSEVHSEEFQSFYLAKVATHLEDLILIAVQLWLVRSASASTTANLKGGRDIESSSNDSSGSGNNGNNGNNGNSGGSGSSISNSGGSTGDGATAAAADPLMNVHHIATALLCIASYYSGYLRIGSIIMFLHDVSDIPLDLLRISLSASWRSTNAVVASFLLTLLAWLYWRLWYFPSQVIYSVAFESKSLSAASSCFQKLCSWANNWDERLPFVALLLCLQFLHIIWFYQMIKKGQRELMGKSSSSN